MLVRRYTGALRKASLCAAVIGSFACGPIAYGQSVDMTSLAARTVESNPDVAAQREAVKALEARLRAARSGFFPTAEANAVAQHRRLDIHNQSVGDDSFNTGEVNVETRLRVYDGWRTSNSVQVANRELESGRAVLAGTVSDVLLKLLQASADVRRDRKISGYVSIQYSSIAKQLAGLRQSLKYGEATRTDESQAQARLATSRAEILSAEEDLGVSESAFQRISGELATEVPDLPGLIPIPPTLEEAVDLAMQHSQRIIAAKNTAAAADEGIDYARGALAPQVDLVAGYEFLTGGVANLYTGRLPQDRSATYAGVSVRVPIFQGGREYAEISRTKAVYGQRMAQLASEQRAVVYEITSAWIRWKAAVGTIEAAREAVSANERAAAGVAQEAVGGNRTTLDVLNAQNELLSARVSLERAERNEFVARANVLAVAGVLDLSAFQPLVQAPQN